MRKRTKSDKFKTSFLPETAKRTLREGQEVEMIGETSPDCDQVMVMAKWSQKHVGLLQKKKTKRQTVACLLGIVSFLSYGLRYQKISLHRIGFLFLNEVTVGHTHAHSEEGRGMIGQEV